jgi:hypothetical protein
MENYNLFSTPLWMEFVNIDNSKLITQIHEFQNTHESVSISNEGGYQSPEFHCQELLDVVQQITPRLENKPLSNFSLYSWININGKGHHNRRHTHISTNIFLSGIYYVKVPQNSGRVRFYDPRGALIQSMPDHLYFNSGTEYVFIEPQEGMIMFFPSWLEHDVEPSKSDEDRISIAFNVSCDTE